MHGEDLALARRVIAKDRRAAEQFFDEHFARLYRFIARRVDETACEDLVQETMIRGLNNLSSYRGEASLFTWLCQIGRHEISRHLERRGRRERPLVSLDDDLEIAAALESLDLGELEGTERLALEQLVQLTLDYLPRRYSRILEYKYLEGLTVEEIAHRLDTGMVAVQSLLARARSAFRVAYRDVARELEPTA